MPYIVRFSECGLLCLRFLNVGCDYYKININREHCIILASGFHDKLVPTRLVAPRSPVMVYIKKKKYVCIGIEVNETLYKYQGHRHVPETFIVLPPPL